MTAQTSSATAESALLDAVVYALAEGVVVVDADGGLLVLNPAADQLLGPVLGWLLAGGGGGSGMVATEPDGRTPIGVDQLPLALALAGHPSPEREICVHRNGEPPVRIQLAARRMPGGGAVLTVRDVAGRHQAERAVREAEERFRLTFEAAPVGMALVAATQDSGRLLQVNRAFCELTGRTEEQLLTSSMGDLLAPADVQREADTRSRLVGAEGSGLAHEVHLVRGDGTLVWAQLHVSVVREPDGRALYVIVQAEDVGQRKRFEARLRYLAEHDPLTGLLNRRRFQDELEGHVQRCERYGAEGVVMLLDLDGFKDVNDTLGHAVGDDVLRRVAEHLSERLRTTDVVARLGGDEFAVLLPKADVATAEHIGRDLIERLVAAPADGRDPAVPRVTATVGIAALSGGPLAERDLLAEADVALYEAKERGRGGVGVFAQQGQRRRIAQRRSWLERIDSALAGEGFVLHAQPVHDYATSTISHYELLLRMSEPGGGLVAPARFLEVAERHGSIRAIDRWVLRRAIELLSSGDRHLLVNLSAASLLDEGLARELEALLAAAGVDPSRLTLEVTETAAIAHMDRARALADQLRSLGCGLALDDFGAGFASFYYLKHLPVDLVKIDGEFVRDVAVDAMSQAVVSAVVKTAGTIGSRTIAECVEDAAAFTLLRDLGVDAAQGYFIGRPQPFGD